MYASRGFLVWPSPASLKRAPYLFKKLSNLEMFLGFFCYCLIQHQIYGSCPLKYPIRFIYESHLAKQDAAAFDIGCARA